MSTLETIVRHFEDRSATIGVVGLGYVGLPTVKCYHDAGFRVVGYDIDPDKPRKLKAGQAYLNHLGEDWIRTFSGSPRFSASSDPKDLASADAVFLCVPTPLGKHREPDLTYVENSTETAARVLKPGALVMLTSTSYPGTAREHCLPILERVTKGRCGDPNGFYLAFTPEREDPGRQGFETRTIPRLFGGIEPASTKVAGACLRAAVQNVIECETAEIAEAAKLLENIYRCVNIALVNELKPTLAAMGIDIWKVVAAASTKPYGFQAFYPGPGLGGHCIPIDPFYLTWKAHEFNAPTRFIELAGEINAMMPHYVVERTARALSDDRKALNGADVLVLGLAYKPNIDDVRETPAAEIITLLEDAGAKVSYHDPHVPKFPRMRKYQQLNELVSEPLTPERLKRADAVVIVTDHAAVDYTLVGTHARLIVDTRNAMARAKAPTARVVKA